MDLRDICTQSEVISGDFSGIDWDFFGMISDILGIESGFYRSFRRVVPPWETKDPDEAVRLEIFT